VVGLIAKKANTEEEGGANTTHQKNTCTPLICRDKRNAMGRGRYNITVLNTGRQTVWRQRGEVRGPEYQVVDQGGRQREYTPDGGKKPSPIAGSQRFLLLDWGD